MKKWLRRFGYFVVLLIWAALMLFPIAAFNLANKGEYTIRNTRVFLISERREGGVGFQTTRPVEDEAMCMLTSVRYLMWEGEGDNSRACSCDDGVEREPRFNSCVAP